MCHDTQLLYVMIMCVEIYLIKLEGLQNVEVLRYFFIVMYLYLYFLTQSLFSPERCINSGNYGHVFIFVKVHRDSYFLYLIKMKTYFM